MDIQILSLIGIFFGLFLLMFFSFKGHSLIIISPIISAVVLLMSGENVLKGLTGPYSEGFANFAKSNFLLLLPAIILGDLLSKCGAASDIANSIAKVTGKSKFGGKFMTLMGLSLITTVLVFGGISGFVLIFTIAPICKVVFKQMDIPWHFIIAVTVFGGSMWTSIIPGSPALGNLIPIDQLGTSPMSGPMIGLLVGLFDIVTGAIYIKWQLRRAEKRNEGFEKTGAKVDEAWKEPDGDAEIEHGSLLKALAPSIVLLVLMNAFGMAPQFALTIGCLVCAALYYQKLPKMGSILSDSGKKTATTVINICAIVGFGGVISHVTGFQYMVDALDSLPGSPLFQLALATNIIAGITGSATGGEGIVLQTLVPKYMAMGINPDVIHRVVAISCCGLDSLPHNGTVVTRLQFTHLTHRQGYYHEFFLGAVIPFISSFLAAWIATLGII